MNRERIGQIFSSILKRRKFTREDIDDAAFEDIARRAAEINRKEQLAQPAPVAPQIDLEQLAERAASLVRQPETLQESEVTEIVNRIVGEAEDRLFARLRDVVKAALQRMESTTPLDAAQLERIAQRVVATISPEVIERVAWEVVPDLAELLIKKELAKRQPTTGRVTREANEQSGGAAGAKAQTRSETRKAAEAPPSAARVEKSAGLIVEESRPAITAAPTGNNDDQVLDLGPTQEPARPTPRTRSARDAAPLPVEVKSDDERLLHEAARRFARLLVDEIKLYNRARVEEAQVEGNLYGLLQKEIDKSREAYDERYHQTDAARYDYFHHELVNALLGGDASKLGSDYPGEKADGQPT